MTCQLPQLRTLPQRRRALQVPSSHMTSRSRVADTEGDAVRTAADVDSDEVMPAGDLPAAGARKSRDRRILNVAAAALIGDATVNQVPFSV